MGRGRGKAHARGRAAVRAGRLPAQIVEAPSIGLLDPMFEPPPVPYRKKFQRADDAARLEMEAAMQAELRFRMAPACDLAGDKDRLGASLCRRLIIGHVTKKGRVGPGRELESLLTESFRAIGVPVFEPDSETHPFDRAVAGRPWSIKGEMLSKKARPKKGRIAKMMSIGDGAFPKTKDEALLLLREGLRDHMEHYERIIFMRAFDHEGQDGERYVRYELYEVPKELFDGIETLDKSKVAFTPPKEDAEGRKKKSGRMRTPLRAEDGSTLMDLVFDTDRKLTIENLNMDRCKLHGTFLVPYGEDVIADYRTSRAA